MLGDSMRRRFGLGLEMLIPLSSRLSSSSNERTCLGKGATTAGVVVTILEVIVRADSALEH